MTVRSDSKDRVRALIAAGALATLLCAMAVPLWLCFVQVFLLDAKEYGNFVLGLVKTRFYVLVLPGFLFTVVEIATLIDVFRRWRGNLRSAIPVFVAIVLLNVLAVTFYWLRELRTCLKGREFRGHNTDDGGDG